MTNGCPHRLQNRRLGGLGLPQRGQGSPEPAGALCPAGRAGGVDGVGGVGGVPPDGGAPGWRAGPGRPGGDAGGGLAGRGRSVVRGVGGGVGDAGDRVSAPEDPDGSGSGSAEDWSHPRYVPQTAQNAEPAGFRSPQAEH